MEHNILTSRQRLMLQAASREPAITKHFVLSGGTALAGFYLFHRDSEDLDFFSTEEIDLPMITAWLKTIKKTMRFKTMDIQTSFNRNLIFLAFPREMLKCEFTYFPFTPLEKGIVKNGMRIDSLLDIAVNKVFTIAQKPRARDFIDLYCILKNKKEWSLDMLLKKSRLKFDWHVDPFQFGTQLMKAEIIADLPRMRIALPEHEWRIFFMRAAKSFRKNILVA